MAKATEVAADMAERTRSENFRWLRDRNRMVENINLAIEGVILSYFFIHYLLLYSYQLEFYFNLFCYFLTPFE